MLDIKEHHIVDLMLALDPYIVSGRGRSPEYSLQRFRFQSTHQALRMLVFIPRLQRELRVTVSLH